MMAASVEFYSVDVVMVALPHPHPPHDNRDLKSSMGHVSTVQVSCGRESGRGKSLFIQRGGCIIWLWAVCCLYSSDWSDYSACSC